MSRFYLNGSSGSGISRSTYRNFKFAKILPLLLVLAIALSFVLPVLAEPDADIDIDSLLAGSAIGTCSTDLLSLGGPYDVYYIKLEDVDVIGSSDMYTSVDGYLWYSVVSNGFATWSGTSMKRGDTTYENAKGFYNAALSTISLNDGVTLSETADHLLMWVYFYNGATGDLRRAVYLLIDWEPTIPATQEEVQALKTEIAKVDGENAKNFYQTNDRYNGKDTSKTGFWSELTPILTNAKTLAETEGAGKKVVNNAKAKLSEAIAKLIPAERANTTLLHEELLNEPDKADYTPKSWSAYIKLRDQAEAMMSDMFDEEGKPTDANTSAGGKQKELETLAAELTQARKALDKRASLISTTGVKRAELAIAAIEELQSRYEDADLSEYTDDSVETLQNELAKAGKLA